MYYISSTQQNILLLNPRKYGDVLKVLLDRWMQLFLWSDAVKNHHHKSSISAN